MSFKQIINKTKNHLFPIISLAIGLDSMFVGRSERNARLNQETNDIRRLSSELERNKDIIISQQDNQNKIEELTNHVNQQYSSISENDKIINEINNKLNDSNLNNLEKEGLIKDLTKHYDNLSKSLETTKNDLNEINEIINSYKPKESNILSSLNEIIIQIREYYSTLEIEQMVALIHLSAFVIIISNSISIFSMIYSDYLIKYFNLENKFPKLHKYFLLRSKINKYSLIFSIIMVITTFVILILLELYLLFF